MLSVIINVKNGEAYLARCLRSLQGFAEVIVCDNYSTDNTLAIAQQFANVQVVQTPFNGMGPVRNYAAAQARNDWVFFIDCDEVLSADLADFLLTRFTPEDNHVYRFYRLNYYAGKQVTTSAWGNDWVVRLYNRQQTAYSAVQVHESVIINQLQVNSLNVGPIYHFPYARVEQLVAKMQSYSTWYAKQNVGKKKVRLWLLPLRTLFMFIKCYVIKRGFLDGYEGLTISMFNAVGVWTKYIKLYELSQQKLFAIAVEIKPDTNWQQLLHHLNSQSQLASRVVLYSTTQLDAAKQLSNLALNVDYDYIVIKDSMQEALGLWWQAAGYAYPLIAVDSEQLQDINFLLKLRRQFQRGRLVNSQLIGAK